MKSWIKTLSCSVALAIAFTTTTLAQIASDNAGNYPDNSWTNGSNGGTGFGAWVFTIDENSTDPVEANRYYAGLFIGDPAAAEIITNANFSDPSFGLYANPDGTLALAQADRNFASPLGVGNTFSLQWGVNWDSGAGNKGFNIYTGGAGSGEIVNINHGANGTPITLNGQEAIPDAAYGQHPMTWSFTMLNATTLKVDATGRDGTPAIIFTTNITVSSAPNSFRWYTSAMQAGDQRQSYFNNLLIEEGTPPALSFNPASASPGALGDIIMTLERSLGSVGDTINLVSDNEAAVTVPASVTFGVSAESVTFTGTVVSLVSGSAVITASEGTNEATFQVNIADPTLSLSGPGSVYTGTTNTYTLTRTGFPGDSVTITNSDGLVLSAPSNVTFEAASSTVTFDVVAAASGSANLQAVGNAATSEVVSVSVVDRPTTTNIYDDASFYPLGWPNGDNGGNGFEPWSLAIDNGGVFIGDATEQGANNAGINTGGVAFGLYTSDGAGSVNASRSFSSPLGQGDVFTFSMAYKFDNGTRGFALNDNSGEVFYLNINGDGFSWSGEGSAGPIPWQDADSNAVREAGVVLDVGITRTASGFDLAITTAQDPEFDISGSFASGFLTGFKAYISGAGSGVDGNLYLNKFEVTPSSTGFLSISGPTNVLDVATPVYTLTRNSATLVSDNVFVGSSTNSVIESPPPGSIAFEPGALTTTFRLDTVAAGSTELLIICSGASNITLDVTVTAGPDGVYDQAAYYYGDWRDGDNNGKGFNPWILDNGGGGFFLASSSQGGARTNNIDTDGVAFGMYNTDGNSDTVAIRALADGVWSNGSSLGFNYSFRFDAGSRGVTVHDASLGELGYFNITNSGYDFNGTQASSTVFTAEREFGEVLTFTFTQNGDDLDWTVSGIHPSSPNLSGTIATSMLGAVRFYSAAGEGGDDNNIFFNNFFVTESSGPGPQGATIDTFALDGGVTTVTLQGVLNENYELVYTTNLMDSVLVWKVVDNASGEGVLTLIDTNELTGSVGFYGIRTSK